MADAPPEIGKRRLRTAPPALRQSVGHDRCVHRAGAGCHDAFERKVRLVEQPIEDAPGEGAMRATAL